jgi:DNA-binding transcriptional LysR family regulator
VLEFDTSYYLSDLDKQRADVVVRFQDKPVEHLYGRRVGTMRDAVYASLELARSLGESTGEVLLIGWSNSPRVAQRAAEHGFPSIRVSYVAEDIQTQRDLAIAGEGIAVLPCFVGDPERSLVRVSQGRTRRVTDVWVLTHHDHKTSARVQAVARFCADTTKCEMGLFKGALA